MSVAPSRRIVAGRQRLRLRPDRATGVTANPRRQGYGKERVRGADSTQDLFAEDVFPQGLKYQAEFVSPEEEQSLLRQIEHLPFREFEFHGFIGKRRTVSFGWRYDFNGRGLTKTDDVPEFLSDVRARAEAFAGIAQGDLQQVLVTEYKPGAGIGWHKDRSVFGDVLGISLLSSCIFRLRRKAGKTWERRKLIAEPRSVYLLRGPSRFEWEHSINGVLKPRYSITFRNVLEQASRPKPVICS
jgi:alkylated DNA repair dioxygenase AlkB